MPVDKYDLEAQRKSMLRKNKVLFLSRRGQEYLKQFPASVVEYSPYKQLSGMNRQEHCAARKKSAIR